MPKKENFFVRHRLWWAVLLPLAAYAAVQPFVEAALAREDTKLAFTILGVALLAFVLAEGLFFRFVLLPRMGEAVGEKIYGGTYIPADDVLVQAVEEVRRTKDKEKLPALRAMVQADRSRLRGWLELARLYRDEFADAQSALETLEEGADCVSGKEDRALLLYRAAQVCEQLGKPDRRRDLLQRAAQRYGRTVYGKKAAALL